MPSLLLVGVLGNDLKWRVISASHLYAQYIICAMIGRWDDLLEPSPVLLAHVTGVGALRGAATLTMARY